MEKTTRQPLFEAFSYAFALPSAPSLGQKESDPVTVLETRLSQTSIFETLQENLKSIHFSRLLTRVMTIADEIESQLDQAMESYIAESATDTLPA